MRIITGKAKGMRLETPEGLSTRPTAERVKMAIFSSLQFDLEGRRVLDLFAGSGQMGLEAMSRGASSAMFVDSSDEAMRAVKNNAKKTGVFSDCRYLISDYRNYLRKAAGRDVYDIVFLDPPYASDALPDALRRLVDGHMLAPRALVVCESEEDILTVDPSLEEKYISVKGARYGRVFIHILEVRNGD